jgi:hypothetical protein
MDLLRIKLGKTGNDFVISITRNPGGWECVDKNGKVLARADSKRKLKKLLKEMGL